MTFGRVRPFLAGLAGVARVRWKVEGASAGDGERSGSESSFGLGGRVGLAVDVDRGDHPVSFLAEAHLLDPGTLGYARARSDSGATDALTPADVTVLSLRVGVTLGF